MQSYRRASAQQQWGTGAPIADTWTREDTTMLFALALILLIAWALGLGGVYAIGSIVHVLLVIAIVLFLVGLITGRETVV
jgi:hypothetical protein